MIQLYSVLTFKKSKIQLRRLYEFSYYTDFFVVVVDAIV